MPHKNSLSVSSLKKQLKFIRGQRSQGGKKISVGDVVIVPTPPVDPSRTSTLAYPQERVARKERLVLAAAILKKRFVGIDEVIDSVITKITYWYLYPERAKRPLVINLWGMTGVGKTDLVRNLKDLLGFQGCYAEIAMHNGTGDDTVLDAVDSSAPRMSCGDPGIMVIDEFQRFRTMDTDGEPIRGLHYRDLWQILSDGILLDHLTYSAIYRTMRQLRWDPLTGFKRRPEDDRENPADQYSEEQVVRGPGDAHVVEMLLGYPIGQDVSPFDAGFPSDADVLSYAGKKLRQLARALETKGVPFDPSVHGILSATYGQMAQEILSDRVTIRTDFTKSLIFVIGNLDSLFLRGGVEGASVPADFLRVHTQRISVIDVKKTLAGLFFPEQVARLGNVHVSYPSLSQEHFNLLASKCVGSTAEELLDLFPNMVMDPTVLSLIIRNGVYPEQGVRPLFTTANEVASEIATMLHTKYPEGDSSKGLCLLYDLPTRKFLLTAQGKVITESPYEGDKDRLTRAIREDKETLEMITIHEAGHALMGYCAMGEIPDGIVVQHGASYNINQQAPRRTFGVMVGDIMSFLAGAQAVRVLLGREAMDGGHERDLQEATTTVVQMVRNLGMASDLVSRFKVKGKPPMAPLDSRYSYSESGGARDSSLVITNTDQEAWFINNIIAAANTEVVEIITKHQKALRDMAAILQKDLFLDKESIKVLLNKNRVKPNTSTTHN